MYSHTYVYIIFGGSQKRTLAISSNKKMNEASTQKCLTAIVGKAFPEEYTIQTHLHTYLYGQPLISVCVCGSHLPKVLMYFLALWAIFVKLCIFAKKIPKYSEFSNG